MNNNIHTYIIIGLYSSIKDGPVSSGKRDNMPTLQYQLEAKQLKLFVCLPLSIFTVYFMERFL